VQVSYDSDVDLALKLLEEAAQVEPRVLKDPKGPAAFLVRFADSGIDLELGIWISDPERGQLQLRSAINRRILASFQANGIRIPIPQREYRMLAADPEQLIPKLGEIPRSPPKIG